MQVFHMSDVFYSSQTAKGLDRRANEGSTVFPKMLRHYSSNQKAIIWDISSRHIMFISVHASLRVMFKPRTERPTLLMSSIFERRVFPIYHWSSAEMTQLNDYDTDNENRETPQM